MPNNDKYIQIGDRIKKQRILLGYTRETLAEKMGITPRYCYDLELGLKKMSLSTLCSLSSELHLSTDYILFGEKYPSDNNSPFLSLLECCPSDKKNDLLTIISAYISAVSNNSTSDMCQRTRKKSQDNLD